MFLIIVMLVFILNIVVYDGILILVSFWAVTVFTIVQVFIK